MKLKFHIKFISTFFFHSKKQFEIYTGKQSLKKQVSTENLKRKGSSVHTCALNIYILTKNANSWTWFIHFQIRVHQDETKPEKRKVRDSQIIDPTKTHVSITSEQFFTTDCKEFVVPEQSLDERNFVSHIAE